MIGAIRALLRGIAYVPALLASLAASSVTGSLLARSWSPGEGGWWVFATQALAFAITLSVLLFSMAQPMFESARLQFERWVLLVASSALHLVISSIRNHGRWALPWGLMGVLVLGGGYWGLSRHLRIRHSDSWLNGASVEINKSFAQLEAKSQVESQRHDHPQLVSIHPELESFLEALEILAEEGVSDRDRYRAAERRLRGSPAPKDLESFLPWGLRCKLLLQLYLQSRDTHYLRELDQELQPFFDDGLKLGEHSWRVVGHHHARELTHNLLAGLHLYWATEFLSYSDVTGRDATEKQLMDRASRYFVEMKSFSWLSMTSKRRIVNNLGDILINRILCELRALGEGATLREIGEVLTPHRQALTFRIREIEDLARGFPDRIHLVTLAQLTSLSILERAIRISRGGDSVQTLPKLQDDCQRLVTCVGTAALTGASISTLFDPSEGYAEIYLVLTIDVDNQLVAKELMLCRAELMELKARHPM